jgi:hypothetical protein
LAAFLFAMCIISRLHDTLLLRRSECLWLIGSNPARGAARRTLEINNLELAPYRGRIQNHLHRTDARGPGGVRGDPRVWQRCLINNSP